MATVIRDVYVRQGVKLTERKKSSSISFFTQKNFIHKTEN